MRTWYPVSIPAFYNPVTSLLKPAGEKDTWSGMKTTGQLRYERGIKLKQKKDSLYKVYFSFVLFCFLKPVRIAVCLRPLQTKSSINSCSYTCMCDFRFLSTRHSLSMMEIKQLRADCCGSVKIYEVICRVEGFSRSLLRLLL